MPNLIFHSISTGYCSSTTVLVSLVALYIYITSDVNKECTHKDQDKDKDKDQSHKDKD